MPLKPRADAHFRLLLHNIATIWPQYGQLITNKPAFFCHSAPLRSCQSLSFGAFYFVLPKQKALGVHPSPQLKSSAVRLLFHVHNKYRLYSRVHYQICRENIPRKCALRGKRRDSCWPCTLWQPVFIDFPQTAWYLYLLCSAGYRCVLHYIKTLQTWQAIQRYPLIILGEPHTPGGHIGVERTARVY